LIYYPLILTLLFIGPALAAIAILRGLSMRWHLVLLSLCILYGTAPLLVAWGGISLADHFACKAEVIVYHCPSPSWLGGLLSGMVFAHWLAIFTIPSAILGSIGLIISLVLKVNPSPTKANISGIPTPAFYRSRRHKVIAGLCVAVAQRWKLPIQGVRIVTVALAVIIPGLILFLYLLFWLALPLEPPMESNLVSD